MRLLRSIGLCTLATFSFTYGTKSRQSAADVIEGVLIFYQEKIDPSTLQSLSIDLKEAVISLCGDASDNLFLVGIGATDVPVVDDGDDDDNGDDDPDLTDSIFHQNNDILPNAIMAMVLTLCAAMAAGLTMGLVSIEPLEMAIKLRSGSGDEMRQAKKILPLVTRHHYLLVSLLLFNSLANEALPIFLENIFSPMVAVVMSVTLILFLGEIVPSAIFTGPNQLRISASLTPVVWGIMFFFTPIAWPIGKLLDFLLGTEDLKRYNRAEISALMEVQHDLSVKQHQHNLLQPDYEATSCGEHHHLESPLHRDEVSIVQGVLKVGKKIVSDAMVPFNRIYCLSMDQKLDEDCLANIIAGGYSRIPIFEGEDTKNIRGYLQVKKLIVLNPEDARIIRSLGLREPEVVGPKKSLLELLNIFQLGRSHIALVSEDPDATRLALRNNIPLKGSAQPIGLISLEDIFEEILQEEIMDESDLLANAAESRAKATLAKYIRRRYTYARDVVAATAVGRHSLVRPCAINAPRRISGCTYPVDEKSLLNPSPYPFYGLVYFE